MQRFNLNYKHRVQCSQSGADILWVIMEITALSFNLIDSGLLGCRVSVIIFVMLTAEVIFFSYETFAHSVPFDKCMFWQRHYLHAHACGKWKG